MHTSRWTTTVALGLLGSLLAGCNARVSNDPPPRADMVASLRAGTKSDAVGGGAVSTGTGWGTLTGTFKLSGTAPTLPPLSTGGKDSEVCGQSVPNNQLKVDSETKGIANVLVFARKVSRIHPDHVNPPETPVEFDQKFCVFLSPLTVVRAGQTVVIKNSDSVGHNTSISPAGDSPINALIPSASSVNYVMKNAHLNPTAATCSIHPWMKAYIMARKDPYFAVSAVDGSFKIENVPAGEKIEFQVWHELAPSGLAAKPEWARGRVTIEVPADGVQDLGTIEIPATAFSQ